MIPESQRSAFLKSFAHPSKAYGQLITQDGMHPYVRTVHFQYLADVDALAVSGNTHSRKWAHLSHTPELTGCFWDEAAQIQWVFSARAQLISGLDGPYTHLLQTLWTRMRPEVRLTYHLKSRGLDLQSPSIPDVNVDERVAEHGALLIRPYRWDIYAFSARGFRYGDRRIYTREGTGWAAQKVCILDSKSIIPA